MKNFTPPQKWFKHAKGKDFAFTLAEILITLGIIGVVAAITIPALINNIQDTQYKTAFKKEYSILSQTILNIGNDNAGSLKELSSSNNTFASLFANQMNVTKSCQDGDSSCWTCNGTRKDDYFLSGSSVTNTSGMGWWYKSRPVIVLADGTFLNMGFASSNCIGNDSGLVAPYQGTICGGIFIDINGCKNPNTWGKDLFYLEAQENKIFALGPSNNNSSNLACNRTSVLSGLLCGEWVLEGKEY